MENSGKITSKLKGVWQYYEKNANQTAKCTKCQKIIKTSYGSTSGLIRHLEQHPLLKREFYAQGKREGESKNTSTCVGPSTSKQLKIEDTHQWNPNHAKAKMITQNIGEWMAGSMVPYSVVDNMHFKKILHSAQPLYKVPSRTTFSRSVVPSLYNSVRDKLSNKISQAVANASIASMSFSCDLWTSRSNDAYMAVTCHFVEHFALSKYCLGCESFSGSHTAAAIGDKLTKILTKWDLLKLEEAKVPLYMVTDNGRNIKLGSSLCKVKFTRLQCFAHTLQLALSDARKSTESMNLMLKKARSIVGHYKHSSSANLQLHKIQEELGLPCLELIQDCTTRWNSEFLMLERLLKNKAALSQHLLKLNVDNLTVSEWQLVENYVSILQPLHEATTQLCSDKTPTASMVIPVLFSMEACLNEHINSNSSGGSDVFSKALLFALKARFPMYEKQEPYFTAMLVDPRFKFVVIPEEEKSLSVTHLQSMLQRSQQTATLSDMEQVSEPSVKPQSGLWKQFDSLASSSKFSDTSQSEIHNYLGMPLLAKTEDPLKWRGKNVSLLPNLCKLALKYLGISATEAASERVFSSAGNIVSTKRESLATQHVEELVFLHENHILF